MNSDRQENERARNREPDSTLRDADVEQPSLRRTRWPEPYLRNPPTSSRMPSIC